MAWVHILGEAADRSRTYVLSIMGGLGYRRERTSETGNRRLLCRGCGHEKLVTEAWIDGLRKHVAGVVADRDVLAQLLHRFRCSRCQARDLQIVLGEERAGPKRDPGLPACADCGEILSPRRLLAMPGATHCVSCKEEREKGCREEKPVHCERCGARMILRARESVLPTKYFLGCSNYPRCHFVIAGSW